MNKAFELILERLEKERRILLENNLHQAIALNFAKGIVQEVAEEYKGGWIPCSERLPEQSLNSVIGWDEYRQRCCFVQYYGGRWILGNDIDSVKIIAWQPLPDPYQPKCKIPKTNADRIRSMSDEELADFLSENTNCDCCNIQCPDKLNCPSMSSCYCRHLEWLQSEAEEWNVLQI